MYGAITHDTPSRQKASSIARYRGDNDWRPAAGWSIFLMFRSPNFAPGPPAEYRVSIIHQLSGSVKPACWPPQCRLSTSLDDGRHYDWPAVAPWLDYLAACQRSRFWHMPCAEYLASSPRKAPHRWCCVRGIWRLGSARPKLICVKIAGDISRKRRRASAQWWLPLGPWRGNLDADRNAMMAFRCHGHISNFSITPVSSRAENRAFVSGADTISAIFCILL